MSAYEADAQRPSTWHKYKKGLCEGCWAGCCTLPVEASAADLIRLELITEEEAAISLRDVGKKLLKQKVIQAFNPKVQIFVLAQVAGRDCIFLGKDRLCTVYDKRPEVCRRFPSIGPRPGFCPAKPKKRGTRIGARTGLKKSD
jgi:Fe-S-cluster containining protein